MFPFFFLVHQPRLTLISNVWAEAVSEINWEKKNYERCTYNWKIKFVIWSMVECVRFVGCPLFCVRPIRHMRHPLWTTCWRSVEPLHRLPLGPVLRSLVCVPVDCPIWSHRFLPLESPRRVDDFVCRAEGNLAVVEMRKYLFLFFGMFRMIGNMRLDWE